MALDKNVLAKQIIDAFALTEVKEGEPFPKPDIIAAALAEAIYNFVRSGEVTGIVSDFTVDVTTAGTAEKQTGTVSGVATQNKSVGIT